MNRFSARDAKTPPPTVSEVMRLHHRLVRERRDAVQYLKAMAALMHFPPQKCSDGMGREGVLLKRYLGRANNGYGKGVQVQLVAEPDGKFMAGVLVYTHTKLYTKYSTLTEALLPPR